MMLTAFNQLSHTEAVKPIAVGNPLSARALIYHTVGLASIIRLKNEIDKSNP